MTTRIDPTDEIRFERTGGVGIIALDRPQALNALTLPMIQAMDRQLALWAVDPAVRAVVVRGAGGAFCAGGDVIQVYRAGLEHKAGTANHAGYLHAVFAEEYRLDRRIHHYPKPYLALIDGIAMGGGGGISIHGSHRIVTENTRFAMPEVQLGLIPDVGGTWFLARCPGQTGTWAALTGAHLDAEDMLYTGLATARVPAERLEALIAALVDAPQPAGGDSRGVNPAAFTAVNAIVARFAIAADDLPEAPMEAHLETIDRCFVFDQIEEIAAALEREDDPWAAAQRAALERASPTSLKLTLRALRDAAGARIEPCLIREFRLAQACIAGHDYYEGVRALLVDKDKAPRWQPAALAEVSADLVARHFTAPAGGDLSFTD
jgi:enoyl-CoA hydratase